MIDETFIVQIEAGNKAAVAIATKVSFPTALRKRAQKALYSYALANPFEGAAALRRAVGLSTRDSVQTDILPFLFDTTPIELKLAALKALAQKGPFKTCSAQLSREILRLLGQTSYRSPETMQVGIQALVAAVSLGIKEAPEKIPGSLVLVRDLALEELSKARSRTGSPMTIRLSTEL